MEFKCKFGRGGRYNRRNRRRLEKRAAILACAVPKVQPIVPQIDLSKPWTEQTARLAFVMLKASGKTQKAFAEEHGFSDSRFRAWKKKLDVVAA